MEKRILIGPFRELLTMESLDLRGSIKNEALSIRKNAGVLIQGEKILEVGSYAEMADLGDETVVLEGSYIGLPGMIDAHTHLCFGGSRHLDYSERNSGATYQEIAARGGGIWDTVIKTRSLSFDDLLQDTIARADRLLASGITTVEVKSGYGLSLEEELKMLRAIKKLDQLHTIDVVPTCLAAHLKPKDFDGHQSAYLSMIAEELLPICREEQLCKRVDIFIEESAFTKDAARNYLEAAKGQGFDLTVHADQFTSGSAILAVEMGALSADHLEASDSRAIRNLAHSETVATVLPGASLGLGMQYAPARALLDAGAMVAIASDWNPGSAPMGNLLLQAALLGASEKLTDAEVFAGLTFRAAKALGLNDRGRISSGMKADLIAFEAQDYREILYHQGSLKPSLVWKNGSRIGKVG